MATKGLPNQNQDIKTLKFSFAVKLRLLKVQATILYTHKM